MRTRLFVAFLAVILIAFASNLIFERLILKDFEEYAKSVREDSVYWVLASVEGGYDSGRWDASSLSNSLHWAMMLGHDAQIRDSGGATVLTSANVYETLPASMKRRMEADSHVHRAEGEFEEYPLFSEGQEIGTLLVRPISKAPRVSEKEDVFTSRGKTFLLISFLIAGGGAVFLSLALSLYLTNPVRKIKHAAEAVAGGNLKARVRAGSKDEIGRLGESFNKMVENLEREEALRKRLTADIAHELRTPLAVIKANIEAIADHVTTKDEGLGNIEAEVSRLIGLVEGIEEAVAAEESFFTKPRPEKLDMNQFIEGIASGMRPMFSSKGLELKTDCKPLAVMTDPEKLERVIRNLLQNALRHTSTGGVNISCGHEKNGFYIEVKDTGEGIAADELSKIFTRFYKGPASEGVGLGLSIAKELVEVMGGRMEAKSAVGEGTTFRITLPELPA